MNKKGSSKIVAAVLILTILFLVLSFAWSVTAQVMLNNNEEELIYNTDLVETGDAEDTSSKMNDQRNIKPDLEARILPDRYKKEIDRETSGISPSSISLGNAVDAPDLTWHTGGDSNWFGQTAITYDGVDAAQSGPISHNQYTWIETSVTGPGIFSFYWKVSSEENFDYLDFWYSTDGENWTNQYWISGDVDWQQKSYNILDPTTYYFAWEYSKDESVSLGSDCGWVDQVTWEPDEPAGYFLNVYGYNPVFDISITSSTGHGGTTPYSYNLDPDTSVTLTAPEYHGSGAARKKFSNWSGDVSSANRTITLTMSSARTVTANYLDDPVIGSIQVNIEPAGARDTGAQWLLTSISPSSISVQSSASPAPPLRALSEVPDDAIENDVILIKFKPEMASKLDQMRVTTATGGIAVTGISDIDSLNVRHNAKAFKSLLEPLYEISEASKQYRERHRDSGLHLWYEIRIDAKQDIKKAVADYNSLDSVESAEPVYKKKPSSNLTLIEIEQRDLSDEKVILQSSWTPNDPSFANQWHYRNTGQHGGTAGADIDLIYAWEMEKGNPDVIVAIVDGGIQYNHPDLSANMWPAIGPDGIATLPDDHGTHVAGTVAAVTNNITGVAGIAGGSGSGNGVRLMSVDIFDGALGYNDILVYAYQADNGAAISQNSWSFSTEGSWPNSTKAGIDYFNTYGGGTVLEGGLTIFAAGNQDSSGNWYPARYEGVMAVAATNNQDIKASYSNYGTWIEISAPGGETDDVTGRGVLSTVTGNGYDYYDGTSMACPHVSGVAALMVSHAPGQFSANDIRNMLKETADNHYAVNPGYTGQLGSGRLNAYQALLRVQSEMTGPLVWRNSGETITGLDPGSYTVTFKDVAGWTKPTDISIYLGVGENAVRTGTYTDSESAPTRVGVHRGNTFYLDADGDLNFDAAIDRYRNFGTPDDTPVIGDWNGDGYDQIGIRRDNTFYLDYNDNMAWEYPGDIFGNYGVATDTILIGDWNGDGKDHVGVWREGTFFLDYDGNLSFDPAVDKMYSFGASDGTPIIGDWNGDGKDQIGLRHGSIFYLDYDGDGAWDENHDRMGSFGMATDTILIGDWSGDGKGQIGVHRDNTFYLDYDGDLNFNAAIDKFANFGTPDDIPIIGDWNGDGKDQIGIRRGPTFYLDYNGNMTWDYPGDIFGNFGIATDKILLGSWRP